MTSAVELLGCPVCGSLINVQVMRLVMMYHCNECGSEITASAWNSANRADRVLQKRINRMQEALDRLNELVLFGSDDGER